MTSLLNHLLYNGMQWMIFPINYTVRWYRGNDEISMSNVTGRRHTVTGLTANVSYNVTVVVAINICCGAGPVSDVTMVMTNNEPPTLPPSTFIPPTTTPTSSSSPPIITPPGNIIFSFYVVA